MRRGGGEGMEEEIEREEEGEEGLEEEVKLTRGGETSRTRE